MSGIAAPIALCQQTEDPVVAQQWMDTMPAVGIEGLVLKDLRDPYPTRPGIRLWHKLKARAELDLVVVGVVGDPLAPTALLLARPKQEGLRPVGVTTTLPRALSREVGSLLRVAPGAAPRRAGWHGRPPTTAPVTGVEPIVVEVSADVAQDDGVLRHGARLLRTRPDLTVDDLEVM